MTGHVKIRGNNGECRQQLRGMDPGGGELKQLPALFWSYKYSAACFRCRLPFAVSRLRILFFLVSQRLCVVQQKTIPSQLWSRRG